MVGDDADLAAVEPSRGKVGRGRADSTWTVEAIRAASADGGQVDLLRAGAGSLLGEVERAGMGGVGLTAVIDQPEQDYQHGDHREQEDGRRAGLGAAAGRRPGP